MGNRTADILAKDAAIHGELVIQSESVSVNVVRKTDTHIPSFAEQKRDTSLSSHGDPKSPFFL